MKVADVMSAPAFAVSADAPLSQAIGLMSDHGISGLPVLTAEGRVVGILTEGDLMRRVETGTEGAPRGWLASFLTPGRDAARFVQTHGRRVGEVMTPDVLTVTEETPLSDAVALMQRHSVKRLPVLRDGRLAGVISRADIVRHVGKAMAEPGRMASDAEIEAAIRAAIAREPWARGAAVRVEVRDGVAGLDGCLFDLRQRDGIGVIAENAPGVKRVDNRIVCVEPMSGFVVYDPAED